MASHQWISAAIILLLVQVSLIHYITGFRGEKRTPAYDAYSHAVGGGSNDLQVTRVSNDVIHASSERDVTGKQQVPCPANCTCHLHSVVAELDCANRTGNETLLHEINAYLRSIALNVTGLALKFTPLTVLPETVCQLQRLTHLSLIGNTFLTSLPDNCITHLHELQFFIAQRNGLTSLQDGLFDSLTELQHVFLDYNHISSIGPHVFDVTANLPKLQIVYLADNDLAEVDAWPVQRAQLVNNSVINFRHNRISRFTNSLGLHYDCRSAPLPNPSIDLTSNNITHLIDFFHGWNLTGYLDIFCFLQTPFIRAPGYETVLLMFDIPLTCDCRDYDIIAKLRIFTRSRWLDRIHCNLPSQLYGNKVGSVPLEKFVCPVTENCPANCTCIKRPSDFSFLVSCPAGILDHLPTVLPDPDYPPPRVGRFKLNFSSNNLQSLHFRQYLTKTKWIDVSRSKVRSVTDEVWRVLSQMDHVDLSQNQLTVLPTFLGSENIRFRWLSLLENRLRCNCEDRWIRPWLQSLGDGLYRPNSRPPVLCGTPDRLKDKNVLVTTDEDFCRNPGLLIVEVAVPVSVGIVLAVAMLSLLIYRCRVNVFTKFNIHPFNVDECNGEDMSFDAFVCCAGQDHQVARMIVHSLEHSKRNGVAYKVCYHERDFPLGGVITDSIQSAIEHSKRVICLMSNDFVRSPMCMLEFLAAWNLNIERRKHRLIVIKWPDLDLDDDLDPDNIKDRESVRLFVSRYTYIEYDKDSWWQQVLYALPINRLASSHHDNEPVV